jgi:hypothetical protein
MTRFALKYLVVFVIIFSSMGAFAQCDIQHRIAPDGSMLYYMEPVNFYWTKTKSLKGNLVTDMENYFLALQPSPCPEKNKGKKLKSDLELKLSNGKTYVLAHYDTRYLENDSIMELLYYIDKKQMDDVAKFEALSVKMDMKGNEGVRQYVFKLHKKALMEQFACFLEMKDEKSEKNKE